MFMNKGVFETVSSCYCERQSEVLLGQKVALFGRQIVAPEDMQSRDVHVKEFLGCAQYFNHAAGFAKQISNGHGLQDFDLYFIFSSLSDYNSIYKINKHFVFYPDEKLAVPFLQI